MTDQPPLPNRREDLASELQEGPGQLLCSARQARGLGVEDVAAELHLKPSVIEALEHDRYEDLPAPVFVTGYVRGYARLLEIDPEPLVGSLHSAGALRESGRQGVRRTGESPVRNRPLAPRSLGVVLVLAVAGLALVWWLNRPAGPDLASAPTDPAIVEAPVEPVVPARPLEQPPITAAAPAIGGESAEPAPPRESGAVLATAPETEATQQEKDRETGPAASEAGEKEDPLAPEQPETAAASEILVEFNGPSWVDIRDSEGKYKLFGEMKKGDRQVLGGKPPYSLIIGNASAVRIRIADSPFDLDAVAKGNVARFTLDPENLP